MIGKTDEYFLAIAEHGSITKAAQALYVSQPSLSKYLQRLEARIGAPLLDRSCSPLQLTEAGAAYRQYLLHGVEEEQVFLSQIGEIQGEMRGTLRLGIPTYCGQNYLPQILPQFSQTYPQVKIELLESSGDQLEQALLRHEIDLAVLHLPVSSEGLSTRALAGERILFVCPKAFAESVKPATIEALLKQPLLLPLPTQKIGKYVNNFLQKQKNLPLVYLRTGNIETIIRLAAEGLGAGFVPESGLSMLSPALLEKVAFYSFGEELSAWKLVAAYRKGHCFRRYEEEVLNRFVAASRSANEGLRVISAGSAMRSI